MEKRFSGRTDIALTERGEAQAAAAAQRLKGSAIDAIVSSPLRRTQQTAAAVAEAVGLEVTVEDGFAETDFGEWEGASSVSCEESGDALRAGSTTRGSHRRMARAWRRPWRAAAPGSGWWRRTRVRRCSWSPMSPRSSRCCATPSTRR